MNFKNWFNINEIHYTDYYGKNFEVFRKKYSKLKKDRSLFVQFTNHMTDVLEKKPYADPSHRDPIAIYGYPLWYVVDYPADIWYGSRSKYLRVLKNVSESKTLILNYVDYTDAKNYLRRAGLSDALLDIAIKRLKIPRNSYQMAKAFFAVVQHDFEQPENKVRSGIEQTAILKRMGFDAIEDRSTSDKKAIINDREPCQIAFLTPQSFEVLEIFDLGMSNVSSQHIVSNVGTSRSPHIKNERKLAALIAQAMGDKIIEQDLERYQRGGGHSEYYTKYGRSIRIEFTFQPSYMRTRRIGQKKHKEYKLSDHFDSRVTIKGEKPELSLLFHSELKFSEIAKRVANAWNKSESLPEFKHYTYERVKEDERLAAEKRDQEMAKNHELKLKKEEEENQPILQKALDAAGIDLKLSLDKYYYNEFKFIVNFIVMKLEQENYKDKVTIDRSDINADLVKLIQYYKHEEGIDLDSDEGKKLIDLAVIYINNPPLKYYEVMQKRHCAGWRLEEFIDYISK